MPQSSDEFLGRLSESTSSTLLSRPNKVGLICPSVRPQKVSSILIKFDIGRGR